MRFSFALGLAIAGGAAVLLAGCSNGQSPGLTSGLPGTGAAPAQSRSSHAFILRSGVDTRYAALQPAAVISRVQPQAVPAKDLFVSDGGGTVQILKNKTYQNVGAITNGIDDSDGLWVDKAGNLYVANVLGKNVTEYAPGSSSPKCTYASGLVDPINVTTDGKGNVYIADFNNLNNPGYVDKYKQCKDKIVKQYTVSQGPEGIAVDAHNNLFVEFFNTNFNGGFEEFKGGKTTATPLSVTVGSPGGLVIDKKGNLIADDQTGSIAAIAPPYTTATVLASGLNDPFHDSLNKSEGLLFNANFGSATVTVYKYPSGTLVTTLGSGNGISAAEGVSDSPNAVF